MRLAGIYGPGRNALVNLRRGEARRIVKPGQVFNRAHVDDIAEISSLVLTRDLKGQIWNVADDEPAPPQDVIAYAAALLGLEPPPEEPFDEATLSPMAREFYADNKRVSIAKAKADWDLRPPIRPIARGCARSPGWKRDGRLTALRPESSIEKKIGNFLPSQLQSVIVFPKCSNGATRRSAGATSRRCVGTESDSLKAPQGIEIIRNGLANRRPAVWARTNGQR